MKKVAKKSFGAFKRNAGRIVVLSIMTVMVMNGLFASTISLKGIDGSRGLGSGIVMVVSADAIDDEAQAEYDAVIAAGGTEDEANAAANAVLVSNGRDATYGVPAAPAPASGGGPWRSVMSFIAQWIVALGIGIAFFGAIQLAFGFRSDDAEGKNKGLRSMIAGLIVAAIGGAWSTFSGWAGTPTL